MRKWRMRKRRKLLNLKDEEVEEDGMIGEDD